MQPHARSLGLLLALGVACACPRALAEEVPVADSAADARQQYQMGTQAFKDKRYSEAALHFEAAAGFRVNAVALYTAGLAWDLASRPERAADAYARALDVPGLDAKQVAVAKERVALLEKTLGTVAVTAPEGWKVQLDTFTEVGAPARLHGTAGGHALSVRAPGKPIERRDVALEPGKVASLDLKDEPKATPKAPPKLAEPEPVTTPAPATPAPSPSGEYWNLRRAAGVGVAGLGVAALGGMVILGLSANGARNAYNAAPTRTAFDHASSLQTWTNVSLIAGSVLLVGGIVLVVLPDKNAREGRAQVGVIPGGAALQGTF